MRSKCFPPIARRDAQILILGSLPGQMSLQRRQYYAQPQNAFWRIMGELFGAGPELSYAARGRRLREQRVALWDVCASAWRPGSLDTAIRPDSIELNDFAEFFRKHGQIRLIAFNGSKAAELFERRALSLLPEAARKIPRRIMPSTSPANATLSYARKLKHWAALRRFAGAAPIPVRPERSA